MKLLVTAEAFGFGPAVAAAQLATTLRERGVDLTYAGTGHTLDVQPRNAYREVREVSGTGELEAAVLEADAVLVSMDWAAAEVAVRAGKPVAFYDALTWYWTHPPDVLGEVGLYLAQDFPGVRERMAGWDHPRAHVVPPLVGPLPEQRRSSERTGAHASLGGLANPHWSPEQVTRYAKAMERALSQVPGVQVTSSRKVCEALGAHTTTLGWEESRERFAAAERSYVTPGLGNLYDAAAAGVPTLLLPPANDSQGQQAELLAEAGWCDERVQWHELVPVAPIEYRGPQEEVMREISTAVELLHRDESAQAELARRLQAFTPSGPSRLSGLVTGTGQGGAAEAAAHVQRWARALR